MQAIEQVLGLNARIDKGSNELWQALKGQLEKAFDAGVLNTEAGPNK